MSINNVAQIAQALHNHNNTQLVTLVGVSNTSGRMLAGFLSDAFQAQIPRPICFMLALLLMGASQIILAFSSLHTLPLGFIVMALSYGALWSLIPAISTELFGFKHVALNYSLVTMSPGVGGLIMSAGIASKVYDYYADPETNKCYGHQCFRETHYISAALCAFAASLSLAVWHRQRRFYSAVATHTGVYPA